MSLDNTINLVVGDWSWDGHGQTEHFTIMSNLSIQKVEDAYQVAVKKLGFDLIEDVASGYDDASMTVEDYRKLKAAGCGVETWPVNSTTTDVKKSIESGDVDIYIDVELFVHIYLFMVTTGDPTFQYKVVENPHINIGGYGFFGN